MSTPRRPHNGKQMALHGHDLARAVDMYDVQGLSMEATARALGRLTPSVANAVFAALCIKRGHRPAERDGNGYLLPVGRERLREMLRKGMTHRDIQIRLAISASAVSQERAAYNLDLKVRGKRPLPPPGGGIAYCGARLTRDQKKAVEQHLLTGLGGTKVAALTGVSKTVVTRIRLKLVQRLRRKGELLAGCDAAGRRVNLVDQAARIPDASRAELRALILQGVPVKRAGVMTSIGACSAYRIRGELRAELEERGEQLPKIKKLGRRVGPVVDAQMAWLPSGRRNFVLYRAKLIEADGNALAARRLTVRAIAERDGKDVDLAMQIDAMRRGGVVGTAFKYRRADPSCTLGGIASGMI